MKRIKNILIIILLMPFAGFAQQNEKQDTIWRIGGNVNLNFSQVSLTNWAAGGKSSATGLFMTNFSANYKKDKITWDNSADLRIGFMKEKSKDLYKTDDNIDLNSKFGYNIHKNWYYSAFINFKSQFAPGKKDPEDEKIISKFLAPGYVNLGLGFDYKSEKLTITLSPLSGKFTFVTDDDLSADGAFGVNPGKKSRSEFGFSGKFDFKTQIMKNVDFQTKLDLFSNYIENPQYIDVDWNILVNMKINDYLSANLVTRLIYDEDVKFEVDDNGDGEADKMESRVQFMEMFGVGLSLKF